MYPTQSSWPTTQLSIPTEKYTTTTTTLNTTIIIIITNSKRLKEDVHYLKNVY